jgi:hypothetical protein
VQNVKYQTRSLKSTLKLSNKNKTNIILILIKLFEQINIFVPTGENPGIFQMEVPYITQPDAKNEK